MNDIDLGKNCISAVKTVMQIFAQNMDLVIEALLKNPGEKIKGISVRCNICGKVYDSVEISESATEETYTLLTMVSIHTCSGFN